MLWSFLFTLCLPTQLSYREFDSKSLQQFTVRTEPAKLTELDCGPRCLAIVLSLLDRKPRWDELRSRFEVTSQGVSFGDVKRVASEQNCLLEAVHAPGEEIRNLTFPAIGQLVPSTRMADRHFVVVLSVEKNFVRLVDPSRERIDSLPINEFIEIATGNYLIPAVFLRRWLVGFTGIVGAFVIIFLLRKVSPTHWKPVGSLLLLLLCCGCDKEPPAPPKYTLLMIEPDRIDLGTLQTSCERQTRFTIRNISRRKLNLGIASRSCGCLETKLGRETLEPNETTECVLEFRLRNRAPGMFQGSATLAVPEFHESHELQCDGFIQGAAIPGGSTTVFARNADGKKSIVLVDVFHMEKNCDIRVESVDLTFPGVQPLTSEVVINKPEKLALGGFRRRVEIPLKIEESKASGRGIISIAISISGVRQELNADVNYINEK